jgi:DNA modification methylase
VTVTIRHGDCREVLRTLPDESVHCCVTSPPYFGLRDYGVAGQIGLEPTPEAFVDEMVSVFREVRRVLRADGTLWLNLGDSYAGSWGAQGRQGSSGQMANRSVVSARQIEAHPKRQARTGSVTQLDGIKAKDLIGIPWQVAFALRADGWYLRQDIIWSKPNPMPESITDRCTKAHEYIFLLSKSERYYYDQESVLEPAAQSSIERLSQPTIAQQAGSDRVPGKTNGTMKAVGRASGNKTHKYVTEYEDGDSEKHRTKAGLMKIADKPYPMRNKRSVWEVTTQPFKEAHFATFPPLLIEPCIKAGCPAGGTVLDPFGGAGTTGMVACRLLRDAILIELNPEYAAIAERRIRGDAGMFADVASLSLTSQDGGSK